MFRVGDTFQYFNYDRQEASTTKTVITRIRPKQNRVDWHFLEEDGTMRKGSSSIEDINEAIGTWWIPPKSYYIRHFI
jgi:hypothetical protein